MTAPAASGTPFASASAPASTLRYAPSPHRSGIAPQTQACRRRHARRAHHPHRGTSPTAPWPRAIPRCEPRRLRHGRSFRTNADQWRIPIRDRCRFECRLTIEYNHRFDTEATALLPLQTVHAIMQRLQRGTVDGNDHTDGMAHRQFSSRVITEASYRNDTGDSMLSGKLPIATNAISVS